MSVCQVGSYLSILLASAVVHGRLAARLTTQSLPRDPYLVIELLQMDHLTLSISLPLFVVVDHVVAHVVFVYRSGRLLGGIHKVILSRGPKRLHYLQCL